MIVSFSGGETSAFMANWLWLHKREEFEMVFVFANTGQEREETLIFVERCSNHFGFPVVWIEASVTQGLRKGTSHTIVNYNSANRVGLPFENVIKKYGIPNNRNPHCTRELKERPISSYAKSLGWNDYFTAIGIRTDEIDRMNSKAIDKKFLYPLCCATMQPMTKNKINFWWTLQPFRLELKGYQGNCLVCWKKTKTKLMQIATEDPHAFDFFKRMESTYENYVPVTRLKKLIGSDASPVLPIRFYRDHLSVSQLIFDSTAPFKVVKDESLRFDVPELFDSLNGLQNDSCEIYSSCNS